LPSGIRNSFQLEIFSPDGKIQFREASVNDGLLLPALRPGLYFVRINAEGFGQAVRKWMVR
jgi:hypothetical protein